MLRLVELKCFITDKEVFKIVQPIHMVLLALICQINNILRMYKIN